MERCPSGLWSWSWKPVMPQGTGGSNPSLSAKKFNIAPTIHPWRSTQVAVRGSPAKGVGWGDWREGSNPSFSANFVHQIVAKWRPSVLLWMVFFVEFQGYYLACAVFLSFCICLRKKILYYMFLLLTMTRILWYNKIVKMYWQPTAYVLY